MKKIIALMLALLLCLSMFAACGKQEPAPTPDPEVTPESDINLPNDPAADPDQPATMPGEDETPDVMPEVEPEQTPEVTPEPTPEPTPAPAPETTPAPAPSTGVTAADIWAAIVAAIGQDNLPAAMPAEGEMLEGFYGLTADAYSDIACMMPMMVVHATEFCIVRATDADAVQAAFARRLADLDNTWSMYLPDQYELVENAQIVVNGEWMMLVVSEYVDEAIAAFNAATK